MDIEEAANSETTLVFPQFFFWLTRLSKFLFLLFKSAK